MLHFTPSPSVSPPPSSFFHRHFENNPKNVVWDVYFILHFLIFLLTERCHINHFITPLACSHSFVTLWIPDDKRKLILYPNYRLSRIKSVSAAIVFNMDKNCLGGTRIVPAISQLHFEFFFLPHFLGTVKLWILFALFWSRSFHARCVLHELFTVSLSSMRKIFFFNLNFSRVDIFFLKHGSVSTKVSNSRLFYLCEVGSEFFPYLLFNIFNASQFLFLSAYQKYFLLRFLVQLRNVSLHLHLFLLVFFLKKENSL